MYIFAFLLGSFSTLPLGPCGLCVVSAFALKGSNGGRRALCGLLLAELLFMCAALILRHLGVFSLTNSIELFFTMIFSLFLIVFGFITFRSRKKIESHFPSKFRNIFTLSMMNPTILIFYLGLIIMAEKRIGPNVNLIQNLCSGLAFLIGVMLTLLILGEVANRRKNFIINNMMKIKLVIGPIFMILGLSAIIISLK